MHLQTSSANWRPVCIPPNVLGKYAPNYLLVTIGCQGICWHNDENICVNEDAGPPKITIDKAFIIRKSLF